MTRKKILEMFRDASSTIEMLHDRPELHTDHEIRHCILVCECMIHFFSGYNNIIWQHFWREKNYAIELLDRRKEK